jgi:Uma2 family endonuclease
MSSAPRSELFSASRSSADALPTMYDLPSEFPEEPGLPDEFHYLQPHLLSATFRLTDYAADRVFAVGDVNIYYDVNHPLWHRRPDWFAVVGVPRLYEERDLRLSYVIWQERVPPAVVVELVSVGTRNEDLGRTPAIPGEPPPKWQVYEQILQVPYYVVFDRYREEWYCFTLVNGQYQQAPLENDRCWLPDLNIGIGLWQGTYDGITRSWLRWFDRTGEWIPTPTEAVQQQAELAQQQAELAQRQADKLAARLRALGIDPDEV